MSESEFSRLVGLNRIDARPLEIAANEAERAALARRLSLRAIASLSATVTLERDGDEVRADGRFAADIVQICAVSGEDLPVALSEPLTLLFVPAGPAPEAAGEEPIEIEFDPDERDEVEYLGTTIDLGEAVAQSLALAIDPYAQGPDADAARAAAGIVDENTPRGPLAEALAGLTRKD